MPPKRTKAAPTSTAESLLPPPPSNTNETSYTSPPKQQSVGISQAQKQALIDNLQLEVTERARKLRTQYALQAQGLRARLEMRINRIPAALRKRKMQDLLDEHAEKERRIEPPAERLALLAPPPVPAKDTPKPVKTGSKRQSHLITADDNDEKENAIPTSSQQDLPNPKKRVKTATTTATANTKATRTASRKAPAPTTTSTVLSPKSHNSRTLPRSPFKVASPAKTIVQFIPSKNGGRPASRMQVKRSDDQVVEGRSSEASDASAGTTIITKVTGVKAGGVGAKRAATKAAAGGRKGAVGAKKENVPPAAATAVAGGRTLRKRG